LIYLSCTCRLAEDGVGKPRSKPADRFENKTYPTDREFLREGRPAGQRRSPDLLISDKLGQAWQAILVAWTSIANWFTGIRTR
jgi:hypothetical protein